MNKSRLATECRFEPITELTRSGELTESNDGLIILVGRPLALLHWFDAQFLRLARETGAAEHRFPSLIPTSTMERAGYFDAFPRGATRVSIRQDGGGYVLAPAVCYHCYDQLAGKTLAAPCAVSCVGACYRHEEGDYQPLTRQWEFTMREVVFLGPHEWVRQQRRDWIDRIAAFRDSLGLTGGFELASDPFFGSQARGQRLYQRLKELKYELRINCDERAAKLAVASFNLHETFFGTRFGILLPDRSPAYTGCVAFGLERWVYAFVAQRGIQSAEDLL